MDEGNYLKQDTAKTYGMIPYDAISEVGVVDLLVIYFTTTAITTTIVLLS